jgi:hypothetical protein
MSCIGISEVTVAAVNKASIAGSLKTGRQAYLAEAQRAIGITRVIGKWEHHACKVIMADGTDYVFDWWRTLDAANPWLYRTDDWRLDQNEVPMRGFNGFDCYYPLDDVPS